MGESLGTRLGGKAFGQRGDLSRVYDSSLAVSTHVPITAGMGVTTCIHSVVLRHAEILLSGYGDSPGIPNNNKLLEYCSLMKECQWAEHRTN